MITFFAPFFLAFHVVFHVVPRGAEVQSFVGIVGSK